MAQRKRDQLRAVKITRRYMTAAPGSVLIEMGKTRVLCTATISSDPPKWLKDPKTGEVTKGWVTAEYAMLPGSTPDRKKRGPDSRATEIQRLIGRSLRAAVDLTAIPGVAITCDCDVLCADGGTRTAAITGAWVALADALAYARKKKLIPAGRDPMIGHLAAVSVGIVDGKPVLDLDYELDVRAEVDLNVVMDHKGRYVEVQGTAEREPFTRRQLDQLLDLAGKGIKKLITAQRRSLKRRNG